MLQKTVWFSRSMKYLRLLYTMAICDSGMSPNKSVDQKPRSYLEWWARVLVRKPFATGQRASSSAGALRVRESTERWGHDFIQQKLRNQGINSTAVCQRGAVYWAATGRYCIRVGVYRSSRGYYVSAVGESLNMKATLWDQKRRDPLASGRHGTLSGNNIFPTPTKAYFAESF